MFAEFFRKRNGGFRERKSEFGFTPGKRALFQSAHEPLFSVAVFFDIPRKFPRECFFEFAVSAPFLRVRAQIIAYGEVASDVRAVALFENMHLMRALVAAFPKISPARNAEFAHTLVAERLEFGIQRVDLSDIFHDGHDIDDRFCLQSFDGGTADMVHGDALAAEYFFYFFALFAEFIRPTRVVSDDADLL